MANKIFGQQVKALFDLCIDSSPEQHQSIIENSNFPDKKIWDIHYIELKKT